MVLAVHFALGLLAASLAWVVLGWVTRPLPRALLRGGVVAVLAAPSPLIGHGIGVAPAWRALFFPGHAPLAAAALGVVWVLASGVILAVPRLRSSRTPWPVGVRDFLLRPVPYRSLLWGAVVALVWIGVYDPVTRHWPWQLAMVGGVALLAAFLGFFASRDAGRHRPASTVAFVAPQVLGGAFPLAVISAVTGVIGSLAGAGRRTLALTTGAVASGAVAVLSAARTWRAYEYRDVQWVEIQGGVGLAAGLTVLSLLVTAALLVAVRRTRSTRRGGSPPGPG